MKVLGLVGALLAAVSAGGTCGGAFGVALHEMGITQTSWSVTAPIEFGDPMCKGEKGGDHAVCEEMVYYWSLRESASTASLNMLVRIHEGLRDLTRLNYGRWKAWIKDPESSEVEAYELLMQTRVEMILDDVRQLPPKEQRHVLELLLSRERLDKLRDYFYRKGKPI